MNFLTGLVAGLIIAWVAEWTIDQLFWRRRREEAMGIGQGDAKKLQAELDAVKAENVALQTEREEAIQEGQAEVQALKAKLEIAEATIGQLKSQPQAVSPPVPSKTGKSHELEAIRGIGRVFARRFHEAGICTFADLAALDPERAREIAGVKARQFVDPKNWIAEAERLATRTLAEEDRS